MRVSIMIEGQMGLDWPRWRRVAATVEELGFAGLYRSDHFVNPSPPDQSSLEMIVALTYLAGATQRIDFGPLVAPVSFRDPVMLARQAAAIDDLAGGRMLLGLGMGWNQREHDAYGYTLGDVRTRSARLEEALEVTRLLLLTDEPASFEGRFYRLRDATISPKGARRTRILVGGNGPRRTLPLVARYADVWNAVYLPAAELRARNEALDRLLEKEGRAPTDVRRTMMTAAVTPEPLPERLRAFEEAGLDEVMLQWLALDDIDGLRALARAASVG